MPTTKKKKKNRIDELFRMHSLNVCRPTGFPLQFLAVKTSLDRMYADVYIEAHIWCGNSRE